MHKHDVRVLGAQGHTQCRGVPVLFPGNPPPPVLAPSSPTPLSSSQALTATQNPGGVLPSIISDPISLKEPGSPRLLEPCHPYLEQPVAAPMECGDDGRVNVAAIETLPGDRLGWGEG